MLLIRGERCQFLRGDINGDFGLNEIRHNKIEKYDQNGLKQTELITMSCTPFLFLLYVQVRDVLCY